jgi:hypothetical protein
MRSLQATLFVLVMLVLSTQSFRHVYVKWIQPSGSVLDEFRERVDDDIAATQSLDELKAMYAKARAGRKDFEKDKPLREVDLAKRTNQEVYRSEEELRAVILRVEEQERDLTRLWFFWLCGLLSVVLGLLAYARVNPWVGMVGLITGFVEMAVWTSPLWRSSGPQGSFDRLLTLKLVLSFASMALLLALWLWGQRRCACGPISAQDAVGSPPPPPAIP